MQVEVLEFAQPYKPSPGILAIVRVRLSSDGEQVELNDLRVVRNKKGELFVSVFSYIHNGQFLPTITFSRKLKFLIDDAVLPAFEKWSLAASAQPAAQKEASRG